MNWKPPQGVFEIAPWPIEPSYRDDEAKKKLFGIELAKDSIPFNAALKVFLEDTSAALWVSVHWLTDPVVLASKDSYEQTFKLSKTLLDKDQLAARVLAFADEKDASGKFFINEDKVRLGALELYAKICGYVGKVEVSNNLTTNTTNNVMRIELVSPDEKPASKIINENRDNILTLPNVKLVG